MQEKSALKKILRKVAAVATGVGMLGMTLTGALAVDLGSYPKPFDGANTIFVIGSGSTEDNAAVADIALGLPTTQTTGTTTTAGGHEHNKDIPVGLEVNSTAEGFGATEDADDIEGFLDTTIRIKIGSVDDNYDVRDEIRLSSTSGDLNGKVPLTVETGLSYNQDEDWKDRVFVPMTQGSWGYYYVYETTLKTGNYISNSTNEEPIQLEFLGKLFQIEGTSSVSTTNKIVVNVGQKFHLHAGETVVVDGKEVTLVQTSDRGTAGAATVSVDGVTEVINGDSDETVNGLEVRIEDVSDDVGIEFDSATMYVGEKARATFADGEAFIGEDEDDPAWVWDLSDLTGSAPIIGIAWNLNLNDPDEDDNPLYEHPLFEEESICLPFDYACIVFEGLKIDDYRDYEIDTGLSEDLWYNTTSVDSSLAADLASKKVLQIKARGARDKGIKVSKDWDTPTTRTTTDTVLLYVNETGGLEGYRKVENGNKNVRFGKIAAPAVGTTGGLGGPLRAGSTYTTDTIQIDYKDTQLNMEVFWRGNGSEASSSGAFSYAPNGTILSGTIIVNGGTEPSGTIRRYGNLSIYFETDEGLYESTTGKNVINYLGHSDSDSVVAYDVVYGNFKSVGSVNGGLVSASDYDITGYDEDLRMPNGIIILDPDAHKTRDSFEFRVPADYREFKANLIVRSSGARGGASTPTSAEGPATLKDTDVTDLTQYNAIVVGGPAINKVAADLLGLPFPTYGGSGNLGFGEGEAIIQLKKNGANYALVVAGYEADDTKRAGKALLNYADFKTQLTGKQSVMVKGTSLEVSGITVE